LQLSICGAFRGLVKTNARSRFCCLPIFKRRPVAPPVATTLKTFDMA
jgi:hypothetical protein